MSLTRDQWIELWGDVKLMEQNTSRLNKLYKSLGPYDKRVLREIRRDYRYRLDKLKQQIQSVIGQME
jgi:hypothetical protein